VKSDPTFWILARASGFTAYALVTTSVLAGLIVKGRPFGKALRPAAVTDMHGFLALMALGGVAVHGFALVLDSVVTITPVDLVVPGRIEYRPVWTSLGVVSAELMLLIYASFYIRRWIGVSAWRRLHWVTYGVFILATTHGLTSGTDSPRRWAGGIYVVSIGLVATATAWRALATPSRASAKRRRRGHVERRGALPTNLRTAQPGARSVGPLG
jgi:methionine sulfoxide reductase heme-binding subunit